MRLAGLREWLGHSGRGMAEAGLLPSLVREAAPPPPLPQGPPRPVWTPLRLEIAESLWGDGCHWPGAAEEALRLATPLGLSAASSLLLVGAGSGGPALRLADELGAWVCACESDSLLLAAAARVLKRAGPVRARRATLQRWDPAAPAFRHAGFHHAVAMEAFHAPDPATSAEAALLAVARALRPRGQLAVLETMAAPEATRAGLREWCRLERREPPPPGSDWLTGPLERLGFEIRVSEDVTARHVHQAVGGWKRLVREMRAARPAPAQAAALVAEAELWLRRVALLRTGQIRVMRWHAIAPQDPPASVAA